MEPWIYVCHTTSNDRQLASHSLDDDNLRKSGTILSTEAVTKALATDKNVAGIVDRANGSKFVKVHHGT